ncbi:MAG: PhoH family protein, partial [Bulleidia sp.]|nr:PhoH family protein [Bulleidia sp.]
MFLTRLGFGSHMVITGDITQIDLRQNQTSGLVEATKILQGVDEIKVIELDAEDVVRNPIVQKIIERYSQYETKK